MENNNKKVKIFLYTILILAVVLVVFVLIRKNKKTDKSDYVISPAQVSSVDVILKESFPVGVDVFVKGDLPDSCTEIGENKQQLVGNVFKIELKTKKLKDGEIVCAQVIEEFEIKIPLNDVVGISAGEYIVDVNGVSKSFKMDVDNYISDFDPLK